MRESLYFFLFSKGRNKPFLLRQCGSSSLCLKSDSKRDHSSVLRSKTCCWFENFTQLFYVYRHPFCERISEWAANFWALLSWMWKCLSHMTPFWGPDWAFPAVRESNQVFCSHNKMSSSVLFSDLLGTKREETHVCVYQTSKTGFTLSPRTSIERCCFSGLYFALGEKNCRQECRHLILFFFTCY